MVTTHCLDGAYMKKLIVNADDFGLDDETVDWTIKGFETGKISSATIMAGMPATKRAVEYARSHPQFSFGAHLCLVDEKPLSHPDAIPSMIDPRTGALWKTKQFIIRNFLGLVGVDDIKREMMAQINVLRDMGLKISHLDGHGHNHRLPQSLKALVAVRDELGGNIPVRRCQDIYVGRPGLLSRVINGPMQKRLESAHIPMTDHFLMAAGHTTDERWFSKAVLSLPDGLTEIGIHPGMSEGWRRIDCKDCFEFDLQDIELVDFRAVK